MRSASTLVLFSGSYPYSEAAEATFIGPELPYLLERFERVVLVPADLRGARAEVPREVEVEEGYAALEPQRFTAATASSALGSRFFFDEIRARPGIFFRPRALLALLRYAGNAARTEAWLLKFLSKRGIDPATAVFYTYWLCPATLALSGLVSDGGTLVSRAHGFDLYHDRHDPPYIPCQAATLMGLHALFLACSHALDYIVARFPGEMPHCEVCSLGVPSPASAPRNMGSSDGVLRIASCSSVVPVKRIDLLIRGIAEVARVRPGQRIEWTHMGGGPEAESLARLARDLLPGNVECVWRGALDNEQVLAFYRSNPVDVFATTSASEGGVPVAIMEAQSHGIPVVATAVGGILDIVSPANGIALRPTASPEEIGQALLAFADRSETTEAMREASARICSERFDAEINFRHFADRLSSLASERSRSAPRLMGSTA